MKTIWYTLVLFSWLLGFSGFLNAQSGSVVAGGDASGGGGSVSYSVGQVLYTEHSGTAGSVNQGVQQPYELYVVPGMEEVTESDPLFRVYPNPASHQLILSVSTLSSERLTGIQFCLTDLYGQTVLTGQVDKQNVAVVVTQLPRAAYVLYIIEGERVISTFKIIKI